MRGVTRIGQGGVTPRFARMGGAGCGEERTDGGQRSDKRPPPWQPRGFPAFTDRERKYALPFTLLGVVLFAIGIAVGFVVLRFPIAWLIDFGHKDFVVLLDAGSYFSFVAYFLLAFGLVFELPLLITFLGVGCILSRRVLRENRS